MALASKLEDGGRIIIPDFLLLSVVAYTHSNVIIASSTSVDESESRRYTMCGADIPPDVEWQLETSDEYALINLPCSVSEGMLSCTLLILVSR